MPSPSRSLRLGDLVTLVAVAALSFAPAPGARAEEESPVAVRQIVDGIAAQVGTDVVLVSEVTRLTGPIEEKMREAGAEDSDVAMMRSDVLERLIDRKLILLFARRAEIQANDLEIDDAVQAVARENQIGIDEIRQSVESQGMSWDAYRQRLAEEIIQQKVVGGMVRSRIRVEDEEIRKFYDERYGSQPTTGEEVHLEHIAIAARDDKPASLKAACDQVRAALGRVRAGQDFMDVARDVSESTPDLGFVHVSTLAPWMVRAVDALSPGQVSDVLELPVGCAVLRLVERREVQPIDFEEAAPRIQQVLFEQRFEQEFEAFVEKLRKQTYVDRKGIFADTGRVGASSGAVPRLQ